MQGVEGFMYPNEVELQWSVLIVLYPFLTGSGGGRIHSGFAGACVQRRSREAHLPAGAADGAGLLLVAPLPLQFTLDIRSVRLRCT
jgi:predicted membrane protein